MPHNAKIYYDGGSEIGTAALACLRQKLGAGAKLEEIDVSTPVGADRYRDAFNVNAVADVVIIDIDGNLIRGFKPGKTERSIDGLLNPRTAAKQGKKKCGHIRGFACVCGCGSTRKSD